MCICEGIEMKPGEFNNRFNELVAKPLSSFGFEPSGPHLFLRSGISDVALLRCGGTKLALAQIAHFIVCFRHNFPRDIEQRFRKEFITTANDYPFKIRLSQFTSIPKWHYEPINLGIRNYDEIQYGSLKNADG